MPDHLETIAPSRSSGPKIDCQNLDRWIAELAAAKELAESANRAKTAFLAMISHELRTPLTSILGFSELASALCAADSRVPKTLATYTGHVHDAAVHLVSLINRVLDLSKIEAGRMEIAPQHLDVEDSLHEALWMVSERASAAGIALEMAIAPGAEILWADDQMLTEMLLNLLSNAIKFTPAGGRVSLSAAPAEEGGVALTVADTGRGIPATMLGAAFSPYCQLDNHYRRGLQGTGLGLSLVRAMIGLHGGTVAIASPPKGGAVVTLRFPPPPVPAR